MNQINIWSRRNPSNKKYILLMMAFFMAFGSFNSPKVYGSYDDEESTEEGSGGVKGHDGTFRCDWGCGPEKSSEGNGWGYGHSSGSNDSIPSASESNSPSNGSGNGSSQGSNEGTSADGSSGRGRDDYFGSFDRYAGGQNEEKAWSEYKELVSRINRNWHNELTQEFNIGNQTLEHGSASINSNSNSSNFVFDDNSEPGSNFDSVLTQAIKTQFSGNQYLTGDRTEITPLIEYEFQSSQKIELENIRKPFIRFKPKTPQSYNAYKAGLKNLIRADKSYLEKDPVKGDFLKEASKTLFDIATDIIPITSIPKDLYRAFAGKDPFTGKEISTFERALAGGFVMLAAGTFGAGNLLKGGLKGSKIVAEATVRELAEAERILEKATKIGIKDSSEAIKHSKLLEHITENHEILSVKDSALLNSDAIAKQLEPAYLEGTKIVEVKIKNPESFVRVHGEKNQVREWIMKEEDILGLRGNEMAEKFNIPNIPTQISRVEFPAGTKLKISIIGPNAFGKNSGPIQYQILDNLNDLWYKIIGGI